MNLIMDISDRILALNYGEKIAEGLPEEIQRHPEVLKAYLGEEENRFSSPLGRIQVRGKALWAPSPLPSPIKAEGV